MIAEELSKVLSILGDRKVKFLDENNNKVFTINNIKITRYQVILSEC